MSVFVEIVLCDVQTIGRTDGQSWVYLLLGLVELMRGKKQITKK